MGVESRDGTALFVKRAGRGVSYISTVMSGTLSELIIPSSIAHPLSPDVVNPDNSDWSLEAVEGSESARVWDKSSASIELSTPVVEPEVSRKLRASRHRRIDVSLQMQ